MASILMLLHSVFFFLHISTFPTAVDGYGNEGGGHGGVMAMRPPSSSPKIPHRYSVLSIRNSSLLRSPRIMDGESVVIMNLFKIIFEIQKTNAQGNLRQLLINL
jgi:hypothetical protein